MYIFETDFSNLKILIEVSVLKLKNCLILIKFQEAFFFSFFLSQAYTFPGTRFQQFFHEFNIET